MHIEDVLDAFEKAIVMSNEIATGSIFTLSEDDYVSIKELYGLIFFEIYGKKSNFIHLPKWFVYYTVYAINKFYFILGKDFFFRPWMINFADEKYCFDIESVKRELKWQPRFLLKKYIQVIIKKLKDNPERWFEINFKV